MEEFLRSGQQIVEGEPAITAWFAIRMGESTFGIFDAFPDDAGRDAHLSGDVAAALMDKAPDLLSEDPRTSTPRRREPCSSTTRWRSPGRGCAPCASTGR